MLGPRVLSHGRSGNWKVWHHVTKGLVILGSTPFWMSILLLCYWVFANNFFNILFHVCTLTRLPNKGWQKGKRPKIDKHTESFIRKFSVVRYLWVSCERGSSTTRNQRKTQPLQKQRHTDDDSQNGKQQQNLTTVWNATIINSILMMNRKIYHYIIINLPNLT